MIKPFDMAFLSYRPASWKKESAGITDDRSWKAAWEIDPGIGALAVFHCGPNFRGAASSTATAASPEFKVRLRPANRAPSNKWLKRL